MNKRGADHRLTSGSCRKCIFRVESVKGGGLQADGGSQIRVDITAVPPGTGIMCSRTDLGLSLLTLNRVLVHHKLSSDQLVLYQDLLTCPLFAFMNRSSVNWRIMASGHLSSKNQDFCFTDVI